MWHEFEICWIKTCFLEFRDKLFHLIIQLPRHGYLCLVMSKLISHHDQSPMIGRLQVIIYSYFIVRPSLVMILASMIPLKWDSRSWECLTLATLKNTIHPLDNTIIVIIDKPESKFQVPIEFQQWHVEPNIWIWAVYKSFPETLAFRAPEWE